MKGLMENFDLFGHQINFNYNKKETYHSFFGMSLSFILYTIMIFFIHYFSKDFINRSNPRVMFTETELEKNTSIKLNQFFSQTFMFQISIYSNDPLSQLNNTHPFFENNLLTGNSIGDVFIIHTGKESNNCTILTLDSVSYYSRWKANKRLCRNQNSTCYSYLFSNENITDSTVKVTEKSDCNELFYKLRTTPKNTVSFNDYKFQIDPEDKIILGFRPSDNLSPFLFHRNNTLRNIELSIQTTNFIVNPNTPSFFKAYDTWNLFSGRYDYEARKIQNKVLKAHYGIISLDDDQGYFFSDIQKSYALKKNYESYEESESPTMLGFSFYEVKIDKVMKIYERIFKKLQDVFSELGGILNTFISIGQIIISKFIKMKFDYDLINKVFSGEKSNDNSNKSHSDKRNNSRDIPILRRMNNMNMMNTDNNNNKSSFIEVHSSRMLMKMISLDEISKRDDLQDSSQIYSKADKKNGLIRDDVIQDKEKSLELIQLTNSFRGELKSNAKQDILNQNDSMGKRTNFNEKEEIEAKEEKEEKVNLKILVEKLLEEKLSKKPLKFTKADFFISIFCLKKFKKSNLVEKEIIFKKAKEQIYDYKDIINYILLHENFEKLISLVLNDIQTLSFNFLQQRKISEINDPNYVNEERIKKIVEYFSPILKDSKMNSIDEKLLNGFYPSLVKLIKGDIENSN